MLSHLVSSVFWHNVARWDHRPPAEFRKAAREDIQRRYSTIQFEDSIIESVKKTDLGQFQVIDVNGRSWLGRKLVLATGVRDIAPDIPGYSECWANGIYVRPASQHTPYLLTSPLSHSYHCLFCHGYKDRGAASAGVLAIGDIAAVGLALHLARMAKRLAKDVTIYTDAAKNLSEQVAAAIGPSDIRLDTRPISRLEKGASGAEVVLHFSDGSETRTEGFLVSTKYLLAISALVNACRMCFPNRSSRFTNQRPRSTGLSLISCRWN